MRSHLAALAAACALASVQLASAQTPTVSAPGGSYVPAEGVTFGDLNGPATFVDPTHGLPVNTALHAEAVSCSGTVTAGGTAQQLFAAGVMVNGAAIQNQSSGPIYIRSRSSTGLVNATTDQNSLIIPAGGYYQMPHVTAYAYSILGATTGQAFYCRTW